MIVASHNPQCNFLSIDIAEDSLVKAEENIKKKKIQNVRFQIADVFDLPFNNESFDHIFICYLLEHLQEPIGCREEVLIRAFNVITGRHYLKYVILFYG